MTIVFLLLSVIANWMSHTYLFNRLIQKFKIRMYFYKLFKSSETASKVVDINNSEWLDDREMEYIDSGCDTQDLEFEDIRHGKHISWNTETPELYIYEDTYTRSNSMYRPQSSIGEESEELFICTDVAEDNDAQETSYERPLMQRSLSATTMSPRFRTIDSTMTTLFEETDGETELETFSSLRECQNEMKEGSSYDNHLKKRKKSFYKYLNESRQRTLKRTMTLTSFN